MPEPDNAAPADAGNNPAPDNPAGGLPANDPNGEGTTPEEVAKVVKSSGITLPEGNVEDEEGDDPDSGDEPPAPKADEEPAGDAPAGDEEEPEDGADDEEPEDGDEEPPKRGTPDLSADDEKYAFEVTDANGVTFKIAPGAKMEDILAEFEPKNNGQILDILNQLQKAETTQAADKADDEKNQAETAKQERAAEFVKAWAAEAKDLQAQKRIPEGDDGEKRVQDVYKFMNEENDKRIKAGKPTLNSFEDALDKLENKEARDKASADDTAEREAARKNGGKVGGSSAPASSEAPVYKGGAKNANAALRSMGILK